MGGAEGTQQPNQMGIIICELLASAQQACLNGRNADEIANVFSTFYSNEDVTNAQSQLFNLGIMGKRSTRSKDSTARERDVLQIILCLSKHDWKGKHVQFAAADLNKVCNVPAGLGDELQLRREMRELKIKMEDLMSAFLEIRAISSDISKTTTEICNLTDRKKTNKNQTDNLKQKPDQLVISNRNVNEAEGSSRPDTPLYSQIAALRNMQSNDGKEGAWNTVQKKKRPRKTLSVVGSSQETKIKAIQPFRKPQKGTLFVTRYAPQTTADDLKDEIKLKIAEYSLDSVESIKSRYETYTSFKVTFLLEEKKLNQFFKDVIQPQLWSENAFVKPFSMKKIGGFKYNST